MFNGLDEVIDKKQEWESYKTTLTTAVTMFYQRAEDEPKVKDDKRDITKNGRKDTSIR